MDNFESRWAYSQFEPPGLPIKKPVGVPVRICPLVFSPAHTLGIARDTRSRQSLGASPLFSPRRATRHLPFTFFSCPRADSNCHYELRRPAFCPLNYEDAKSVGSG